jgi:hypothetical protein
MLDRKKINAGIDNYLKYREQKGQGFAECHLGKLLLEFQEMLNDWFVSQDFSLNNKLKELAAKIILALNVPYEFFNSEPESTLQQTLSEVNKNIKNINIESIELHKLHKKEPTFN